MFQLHQENVRSEGSCGESAGQEEIMAVQCLLRSLAHELMESQREREGGHSGLEVIAVCPENNVGAPSDNFLEEEPFWYGPAGKRGMG